MLERAKAHGLLVPLAHYKIYVYGASVAGLTPRSWTTIRRFWQLYFAAAGADVVAYSPVCDVNDDGTSFLRTYGVGDCPWATRGASQIRSREVELSRTCQ